MRFCWKVSLKKNSGIDPTLSTKCSNISRIIGRWKHFDVDLGLFWVWLKLSFGCNLHEKRYDWRWRWVPNFTFNYFIFSCQKSISIYIRAKNQLLNFLCQKSMIIFFRAKNQFLYFFRAKNQSLYVSC